MYKPNIFEFNDLQKAWEGMNEYLINEEYKIKNGNGNSFGSEVVLYDVTLLVDDGKIDKNFNFGKVLGYTDKKWTKLIRNYINYNYLDLVASEIKKRDEARNPHYNYTFHFDNNYGHGKDCLISLTFSRRKKEESPTVTFHSRASEITKRLIFDFLLVQRICEYIYGKKLKCHIICHIQYMYIAQECVLMYCAWKGIYNVLKKHNMGPGNRQIDLGYSPFQLKMLKKHQFFLDTPLEKITFKVHQRAAAQVKRHPETGGPLANCKDLFAKQLTLHYGLKKKDKDIQLLDETLSANK